MKNRKLVALLAAGTFLLTLPIAGAHAAAFETIYSFAGGTDGAQPFGAMVADAAGDLYGTTGSGGRKSQGTIYKLAKPTAGTNAWTETVLYQFRGGYADGSNPDGALAMDKAGALYGTTQDGGYDQDNGVIFRLTPPAAGKTAWTETVLHRFGRNLGTNPVAGLVIGADGTLYGTTCGCGSGTFSQGTVFALSPPASGATAWVYNVVHRFTGGKDGGHSHAPLAMDAKGVLYGTTSSGGAGNAGAVFSLSPPTSGTGAAAGKWLENILFSFTGGADGAYPRGGVAIDSAGHLYTTAQYGGNGSFGDGAGTVIELTPPKQPGGAWTEATLLTFDGQTGGGQPGSTPVVGAAGTVFGTTDLGGNVTTCTNFGEAAGCGTVYALHRPAAGQTVWKETVLAQFDGLNGNVPWGALLVQSSELYGTTEIGGASASGTVFSIKH